MKTLYLECNMGVAGDMLMAALLELHPNQEEFIKRINQAGIPHVTIQAQPCVKCGIRGTHMKVEIKGHEEDAIHPHHAHEEETNHHHGQEEGQMHPHYAHSNHTHSNHTHTNTHTHAGMQEIREIIKSLQVPEQVKQDVNNIYELIAQAEGKVHGKTVTEIHFHEVGMMDAIADITGCALLLYELAPEKIIVSPVKTGFGQVNCAHGILPVPAPATALLLEGIPCYAGEIEGELCTPTGAAIVKYFAAEFSHMPQMTVERIGYGMGKKEFPAANCVRAMSGTTTDRTDQIAELSCNLDDMTPEEIGFATEILMEKGALDVYTTSIGMKKARPGILLTVMCRPDDRADMARLLFQHTTTIGIREACYNRMVLNRREYVRNSGMGEIRMKESTGYGVKKEKPEYEDIRKIAKETGQSIREIKEKLL